MKRLGALVALLLLTGCLSNGVSPLGWIGPRLNPKELHSAVFTEAYRRIVTFYLEPSSLNELVPAGFAGLSRIDPDFKAETADKNLQISLRGKVLGSAPMPGPSDFGAWGEVSLKLAEKAHGNSYLLSKLSSDQIYTAVLGTMLAKLDPYSHYLSPDDVKTENEWRTGYGGIGVTFERRGAKFAVVDVFVGSPAEGSGLKAGDNIVSIEGRPTSELSTKEFAAQVRGPIGSKVHLSAERAGELSIVRQQVIPTTVAFNMAGPVAVIRISRFLPGTATEFRNAAREAVWKGARGVVLDLQHNPGGYLDAAVEIANLLLPRGTVLKTAGRHPDAREEYNAGGADILLGLPLVILIDGRSASAAEVLAAAVNDRARGVLIGSTSFGKGSVQNVAPLPNGGEMALTWARMFSPSGKSFHQAGVSPNLCLSLPGMTRERALAEAPKAPQSPCPKQDSVEALALPVGLAVAQDGALYQGLKR